MGVSVKTDPTFSLETPQMLFKGANFFAPNEDFSWDIHPDGKRFLMIKRPEVTKENSAAEEPQRIIVVLNWFEELKDRAPVH